MKNIFSKMKALHEQRKFFREKAEQGQPLSIMDDQVFKYMLASDTEDSREALRCLLSACIRRDIMDVKVLNSELLPAYKGAKSPRLDVRLTFNDEEIADLEMQIERTKDNLKDRASQYVSMLQTAQIRRGEKYKDVRRTYQIFFLDFVLFPVSDKVPRRYGYREEIEYDLLTEKTEIIFYEMPKLSRKIIDYFDGKADTESLSADEKWCIFMKYRHDQIAKPLIDELCEKEEGIMRAQKQVNKLSKDFIRYMTVEMDEMKNLIELAGERKAAREEGYTVGHAEGRVEGRAEGRIEGHAEGQAKGKVETQIENYNYFLSLLDQNLTKEEIKEQLTLMDLK